MCAKLDLLSHVTEIIPCELPANFEDDPNPLNYFMHVRTFICDNGKGIKLRFNNWNC